MGGSSTTSSFVGERFLQIKLPNYSDEYIRLWICIGSFLIFILLALILIRWYSKTEVYEVTITKEIKRIQTITETEKDSTKNKDELNSKPIITVKQYTIKKTSRLIFPVSVVILILGLIGIGCIIFYSPQNQFLARRVFEAPILTTEECTKIVEMSNRAAKRNMQIAKQYMEEYDDEENDEEGHDEDEFKTNQILLQKPRGWQKLRHGSYPTIDLNIMNDPYTDTEREWVYELLNRRLAPTISRIYGIPQKSLSAQDLFVVRYSGDDRPSLARHVDGASISVNILLNNDFVGGGTKFWHRITNTTFHHVKPTRIGNLLTHPAILSHEGMAVTSGERYIMVAFIDVDRIAPSGGGSNLLGTKFHTGISPFASYLNFNWLVIRLSDAYVEYESYIYGSFAKKYIKKIISLMNDILDSREHKVENLVKDEDSMAYLNALDKSYTKHSTDKPRWYNSDSESIE